MVQAIGSFATPGSPRPQASAGGLAAELAGLQGKLADCVNCESANTSAGKAKIQEITQKINLIKARLENLSNARNAEPASPQEDPTAASQKISRVPAISTPEGPAGVSARPNQGFGTTTLGQQLDLSV